MKTLKKQKNICNFFFKNLKKNYPQIISELGINHFGNLEIAKLLVNHVHRSGGYIIKNQTHDLHNEMVPDARKVIPGNSTKSIYEIIKKNHLSFEDELKLKKYVEKKNMLYLSTPFSLESAIRLRDIGLKIMKIGSGEFNNLPLIEKVSKFKCFLILSTGMNDIKSIKRTVKILKKNKSKFLLMHCVSEYPNSFSNLNLDTISYLKSIFKETKIGYSDHSKSIIPSLAAVSKGAVLIEKHFIDNKKRKGPDIVCSMDPNELKNLLNYVDIIHKCSGLKKKITAFEEITSKFAFASVVSTCDIDQGEKISTKNTWVKRPGTGDFLASSYYSLLGRTVKKFIKKDTLIKKNQIS